MITIYMVYLVVWRILNKLPNLSHAIYKSNSYSNFKTNHCNGINYSSHETLCAYITSYILGGHGWLCRLSMATSLDLPLPELVAEDFQCGWTRFEFVAVAKEWTVNKQLTVIPTLLRGRLIDYYVELEDATKNDLALLKVALLDKSDKKEDPLVASWCLNQRNQSQDEKVIDFAAVLKNCTKVLTLESP